MATKLKLKPRGPKLGGLPTYTKQQFQQVRPNGSYQNYLSFLRRQRGVSPSKPPKPQPLPTYQTLLGTVSGLRETPAQIQARANQMAKSTWQAEQNAMLADAARQRAEAKRDFTAMSEAGKTAAAMNKGLFGAVGGEYNAAARELSNLATGSVGGAMLGTDRKVAETNAALARVGAPPVEATGLMAGPAQAGIEAFRGAGLPGQQLVKEGQAAEFGLAGMVGAQNLRATQEAQAAFAQTNREIAASRAQAVKELAAGRTQNAAAYLQQLQQAQRDQIALAMGLISARGDVSQQAWERGQTVAQTKAEQARWQKEYNAQQRQLTNEQKRFEAEQTRWQAENQRADAEADLRNRLLQAQVTAQKQANRVGTTASQKGAETAAAFLSNLGEQSLDPDFRQSLATVYFTRPFLANQNPKPGGYNDKQHTNAVINYLMQTSWPSIELNYPAKQRAQAKAQFASRLRGWFKTQALPDYNAWRVRALKGG